MKTKSEQSDWKACESGNILLYVLIAIALFGALSFVIARQSSDTDSEELDDARVELYATEIIGYARQVQSVVDQMTITGTSMNEFDFVQPGESGFNTAPHIHKVFHPQGGGLSIANLPKNAVQENAELSPGWYLGIFNNVEWSPSAATDMILTAHNLTAPVCASLNDKISGSPSIPALPGDTEDFLIDTSTNPNLTDTVCSACEGFASLCVSNASETAYSFYSIITDR